MRTISVFVAVAAAAMSMAARGYDFDTGDNEGWTYRLVIHEGIELASGPAGWSDISNRPNVLNDPVGDNRGAAQGSVWPEHYRSAGPGDYLMLQLRSPDLGPFPAWQSTTGFSAYLLPAFTTGSSTPDFYTNMVIVVDDQDSDEERVFFNQVASPISAWQWTVKTFDVAAALGAAAPPVTNYELKQVVINFWVAVAADRSLAEPFVFAIDEVSPCATVYNDETAFRAAAGPATTYGFESHGLSGDVNDLPASPITASHFDDNFDVAYRNLNAFNVAFDAGGSCNADGDRSIFSHSVVADDYSLTFSNFDGTNQSTTAFGITVCDFASGLSEPARIAYDTGTQSGTLLLVPRGQPADTSNFVGVVVCPEAAFDTITLTFDDNASGMQWFDEVIYTEPLGHDRRFPGPFLVALVIVAVWWRLASWVGLFRPQRP